MERPRRHRLFAAAGSLGLLWSARAAEPSPAGDAPPMNPTAAAIAARPAATFRRVRAAGDDWHPFSLDWTAAEPPVWDFSAHFDAPAGRHGPLRAAGAHFVAGDSGRRVRLWGTNLSGPACFPTREQAPKVAAFLRRWGFNAVRLSHIDASWARGLVDYRDRKRLAFDEGAFDRFFYFLSVLKDAGIHYVIDGRHDFEFRTEEFAHLDAFWSRYGSPFLMHFSSAMRAHHERYLRELLTRTNPHTGLPLARDPALAGLQMVNESFLQRYAARVKTIDDLPAPVRDEFRGRWRAWAGPRGLSGGYDDHPDDATRRRFLSWLERESFRRSYRFLRDELGVLSPLATTSCYVSAFALPSALDGDFTEGHGYYSHPRTERVDVDGGTMTLSAYEPRPVYAGGHASKMLPFLLHQRIGWRPHIVGEWNDCLPERFATPLLMAAFAGVQDLDGLFFFTLNQSDWSDLDSAGIGAFRSFANPAALVNLIPAALAWHGGLIPPAAEALGVAVTDETLFGRAAAPAAPGVDGPAVAVDAEGRRVDGPDGSYSHGAFGENAFLFRTHNLPDAPGLVPPPPGTAVIDQAERTADRFPDRHAAARARSPVRFDGDAGRVVTPAWVSVWGRWDGGAPDGEAVGPLRVRAGPGGQEFSVTAVALDGRPLAASGRVLVAVGTVAAPRRAVFLERFEPTAAGVERRTGRWRLDQAQNEPRAKPVRAALAFEAGRPMRLFAVDAEGRRGAVRAGGAAEVVRWELTADAPEYFFLLEAADFPPADR